MSASRIDNHGSIEAAAVDLRATDGNVTNSGVLRAQRISGGGTLGGEITITGRYVIMRKGAAVDASGALGGGTVLIGGGYQGKNDSIENATNTGVELGASILADATEVGKGGTVIVWADETTVHRGDISARGAGSGDGGFIEVSGKRYLGFEGTADVGAGGRGGGVDGTVLLDPARLTVEGGPILPLPDPEGIDFDTPNTFTDVAIRASALMALTGNVNVQAHEDMIITVPLAFTNQDPGESVKFRAGGSLTVNAGATITTNGATLDFVAADPDGAKDGSAKILVNSGATIGNARTGSVSFSNAGAGGIELKADVTSAQDVIFDGALTLLGAVTVTSTAGGEIGFLGPVGGSSGLIVNTSSTTGFEGSVDIASLTTNAGGATVIDGSGVTTTGAQSYNDSVVLDDDTVFTSTGGGNVTFGDTLTGAHDATVNTFGMTQFGDTVDVASLATNAGGSTQIDGGVTTSGIQSFNDPVSLGASVVFTDTGGGDVAFGNTLTGPHDVIVNSTGTTSFGGNVDIASLATNAGGSTRIDGSAVTTIGGQSFNDPVSLGASAVFASTAFGNIAFGNTLTGPHDATVNTFGMTQFGDSVDVASLATNAGGSTQIDGGVTASGIQSFNDPVSLGASVVFTNTEGGDVTFGNTLTGPHGVIVNSTGTTSFGGDVDIASLVTNAGGSTQIDADVRTASFQNYFDPVTTTDGVTLTAGLGVGINDRLEIAGDGTIGTLFVDGDLQFFPEAVLDVDISATGSDRLVLLGGGVLTVLNVDGDRGSLTGSLIAGPPPVLGASFEVVTGATTGSFDEGGFLMAGGLDFSIDYTSVTLTVVDRSLRIIDVQRDPGTGALTVTWNSRPGRTYRILQSTGLSGFGDLNPPAVIPSEGDTTDATINFTPTIPDDYFIQISEE